MRNNAQYNVIGDDQTLQLHEYKSFDTLKQASSTVTSLDKPSEFDQAGGHRLRRFYSRALVGVLGPLVVTGYFIAVWRFYLAPVNPDSPVAFGPIGAKWIFYSWFVAGVIGLNLSLYGLKGVEAGMLMEPGWNVGNGMKLMMHADNTWSGPGGWMKTINWSWKMNTGGGQLKLPAALWFILAFPSIFVFTAYPLSGLTMEMTQGYLQGKIIGGGPTVTGFSYANFNERNMDDAIGGARITWKNALDARIPGHGALYTPKGYDRSRNPHLRKLPTLLPKDDGVNRIFLSAQAENPIAGKSWGLLLQYNCSIIDRAEDLRVLNTRNASAYRLGSLGETSYQTKDSSIQITVKNQTNGVNWVQNIFGVMELGSELWPNKTGLQRLRTQDPNYIFTKNTGCYFNEAENATGDYPGIEQEQVFEVLLWQHLNKYSNLGDIGQAPQYNLSVSHNITSLYGAYNMRIGSVIQGLDLPGENTTNKSPLQPMSAIGVQCKASSSVGTADIDGVSSSYSNFMRTDTLINNQTQRCAGRFSAQVPNSIMPKAEEEWLSTLFTSTAAPPPFYAPYTTDDTDVDAGAGFLLQLNYLQPEQLRQSMLRAYAAHAVQLMYNGGQGFTSGDGSHIGFQNPNVTEFVPGTVITRGVMPVEIPIVLFIAWALVGSVLGIMYGFRRRWSATLDGYTMFRLGADLSDDVKRRFADYSNTLEVDECHGLNGVPGLVGDSKPEMWLGRIGLVNDSFATKGKMYE